MSLEFTMNLTLHLSIDGLLNYGKANVVPKLSQRKLISSTIFSHIVRSDAESGKHPVAMTTLLERQLNECGAWSLSTLNPPLPHLLVWLVLHVRQVYATGCKRRLW